MGLAFLLFGAWFVVSGAFGPALILGGSSDDLVRCAGRIGLAVGAGMIVCGGVLA